MFLKRQREMQKSARFPDLIFGLEMLALSPAFQIGVVWPLQL